jgi:hypothetical protein
MDDPDRNPDSTPGTPRWVVAFGVIALLLILAIACLHLAGYSLRGHH